MRHGLLEGIILYDPLITMAGKAILTCRPTSHPFQDRTLILEYPVKIGRSVARARASSSNAIFDCKVLSRNHAVIWYADGKFYLQDTRSSNGTFVNNQRLSKSGEESPPREVSSGDIVQFGVDVLESARKVTHGCIIANLKLFLPDGKEAKPSISAAVVSSNSVPVEDLYELHQYIQEAIQRESLLESKLLALQEMLTNIMEAADQGWKALISEDRLLTRVEVLENQLQMYTKNYGEEKLKEELEKLQEDKNQYQSTTKVFFKKVLEEKLEAVQQCQEVKRSLVNVEAQYNDLNEELVKSRDHVQDLAQRLSAQIARNEDMELKLQEIEEQHKDAMARMDGKNQELIKMLSQQHFTETCLEKQLRELRDAENRTTDKDGLKQNDEVIELFRAQLEILEEDKLASLRQINSLQDNFDLCNQKQQEFEREFQKVEETIENLESEIRQRTVHDLESSDDLPFCEIESNGKKMNGLSVTLEPLESQIKELKALRSELRNKCNACELSKNSLKEELDEAKQSLSKTTESYIITQGNIEKAKTELEGSSVISDSVIENLKMSDDYSNDEKENFMGSELQNQNNIDKNDVEKEDMVLLKKSLMEAQQREKQSKNEAAQLKDKIVALTLELEGKQKMSEDNKLKEDLDEAKEECMKSNTIINLLQSELKMLQETFAQQQAKQDSEKTAEDAVLCIDELTYQQALDKVGSLEENLITLGTRYRECSEEKSKLLQRLQNLQQDYQSISHLKYFHWFFALPCVLLLLAVIIAFYPSLSFFMGTADQPEPKVE